MCRCPGGELSKWVIIALVGNRHTHSGKSSWWVVALVGTCSCPSG